VRDINSSLRASSRLLGEVVNSKLKPADLLRELLLKRVVPDAVHLVEVVLHLLLGYLGLEGELKLAPIKF